MIKKIVYGKFSTILNEEGKEIFRCTDYGIGWTGPNSIEGFRMLESRMLESVKKSPQKQKIT